ncbi:MAG: OmpA family protein [bacterium]|nr:OmpA family protein [bacterium]
MKKIKNIFTAVIIIASIFLLFLFIVKDKFLVRAPLLVLDSSEITFVYGNVLIKEKEDPEWEKAKVGDTLSEDMVVETKKNSKADITFNQGTVIRLASDSRMVLNKYTIKELEMELESGSLYGRFKKIFQKHKISINTGTTTAAVRGTELGFEVIETKKPVEDDKSENGEKGEEDAAPEEAQEEKATVVYALSGVTEIHNPENMTKKEINRIRKILNSIHSEKVLLVSSKILFNSGKASLVKTSYEELNKVVEILKESKQKIRIVGHTDSIGKASINQYLSIERAKSVRKYLIKKGISPGRLTYAGYGSSMPISENTSKAGQRNNRRVEFIIID